MPTQNEFFQRLLEGLTRDNGYPPKPERKPQQNSLSRIGEGVATQLKERAKNDASFDSAFKTVVGHEGRYVNNPADPGGETKYGIAKKYYPDLDIKKLTLDQAKQIYKKDFWDKYNLSSFDAEDRTAALDMFINSPRRAAKAVQKAVGEKPDGIMGPKTLAKMQEFKGDLGKAAKKKYFESLIEDNAGAKTSSAQRINWKEHGNGWANRFLEMDIFGKREGQIDISNIKSVSEFNDKIKKKIS